jgi:hypothetical protein
LTPSCHDTAPRSANLKRGIHQHPSSSMDPVSSMPVSWNRSSRAAFSVRLEIPARFGFRNDQKLDLLPAAAGAVEADAPILFAFSREHEITLWQAFRQAVALDNHQAPARAELFPRSAPRCPYPMQPRWNPHCLHPFGGPRMGSPSRGSLAPRPNMGFAAEVNSSSAKYSSSQAARLKVVRAYR